MVSHYIVAETGGEMNAYKVLPDTALVMGFQYRGRLWTGNQDQMRPLTASGITGMQQAFRLFRPEGCTGTLLVVFQPQGAALLLKTPLHELSGQSVALGDLLTDTVAAGIEAQLGAAATDAARIRILETFLLAYRQLRVKDPLVSAATRLIAQHNGDLRIAALAKQLHTSASPLEKRFRSMTGTTPKKYASIVRFRRILQQSKQSGKGAAAAYTAGFFDQAHFIHEFRRFTGETPRAYFSADKDQE